MLWNYFKTSIRNILKSKFFTFINIFGLSFGLACCILIFLYVKQEFGHERFHKNGDRIFRLTNHASLKGEHHFSPLSHPLIGKEFIEAFPQILRMSGYRHAKSWIEYDQNYFSETVGFVDSTFLQMFTFPLVAGNPVTALTMPHSVVITWELAQKMFPETTDYSQILGKIIHFTKGTEKDYKVTGVLKPIPKTSSFEFTVLLPYENCRFYPQSNDSFGNASIFFEFDSPNSAKLAEEASAPIADKIFRETIQRLREADRMTKDDFVRFELQPLKDMYLNTQFQNNYEQKSNPIYSYVLSTVALLILIIASINFITLSVARSYIRSGEICIRKVLGAGKRHVLQQFLGEALFLGLIAIFLATVLTKLLTPFFNNLAQKELHYDLTNDWSAHLFLIAMLLFVTIVTGLYPGLLLARFRPMTLFKSQTPFGHKNHFFQLLLTFQFILSIILIVSTIVFTKQVSFMQNKYVGFADHEIISIPIPDDFSRQDYELYKEKVKALPLVVNVTGSDRNFMGGSSSIGFKRNDGEVISARLLLVDADYLSTLGLTLLEGRYFSTDMSSDPLNAVVVNETLVKEFEIEHPIGYTLQGEQIADTVPTIVGIIKDFHFDSMHDPIKPLILHMNPHFNQIWTMFVRIESYDIPRTINDIKTAYNSIAPDRPFEYSFLDQDIDTLYKNEERWSSIVSFAAILVIIISSLGLLGLMTLAMSLRVKEIGIRKVLGATVSNILMLSTKRIILLYLAANLIAWPVAWIIMKKWLENFAYHINMSWWMFLSAGFISITIALIIVSVQAFKAALGNPVETLRYE